MIRDFKHVGSGLLMGVAGLFPGVSAGTIALLLGIHERLIGAIANIDRKLPRDFILALRGDNAARTSLRRIDILFVGAILVGMIITTFTLATGVAWLTTNRPGEIMAVFLGLVLFGALIPWRRIGQHSWGVGLFIVPGAVLAIALAFAPEGSLGSGAWLFFVGGVIAMPMMILPGVSGSAMLVTIGLYQDAVSAVADLQIGLLIMFAIGGAIGVLTSAKILQWFLRHHHDRTMAFLTGLLAGSIVRVWPWRTESGFAAGLPTLPDAQFGLLVWTALAAVVILAIERFSLSRHKLTAAAGTDDEVHQ